MQRLVLWRLNLKSSAPTAGDRIFDDTLLGQLSVLADADDRLYRSRVRQTVLTASSQSTRSSGASLPLPGTKSCRSAAMSSTVRGRGFVPRGLPVRPLRLALRGCGQPAAHVLTPRPHICARSARHLRPLGTTFAPAQHDICARSARHLRPLSGRGQQRQVASAVEILSS